MNKSSYLSFKDLVSPFAIQTRVAISHARARVCEGGSVHVRLSFFSTMQAGAPVYRLATAGVRTDWPFHGLRSGDARMWFDRRDNPSPIVVSKGLFSGPRMADRTSMA